MQEGFELHGDIAVTNPSPLDMTVLLNETISDGTPITIEAGTGCAYDVASSVLVVPANSVAICHYTGAPTDSSSEVSTVTVSLNSMTFTDVGNVVFTIDQTLDELATLTDPSLGFSQVVTSSGLQSFTETTTARRIRPTTRMVSIRRSWTSTSPAWPGVTGSP